MAGGATVTKNRKERCGECQQGNKEATYRYVGGHDSPFYCILERAIFASPAKGEALFKAKALFKESRACFWFK